jgi:hypothetical protein
MTNNKLFKSPSISNLSVIDKLPGMWSIDPDNTMKYIFFVRDKKGHNNSSLFIDMMKWVYHNHKPSFFKNLSLVVGIPNELTIPIDTIEKSLKESLKVHEIALEYYIHEDSKDSFREYWNSVSKEALITKYITTYNIPEYGTWNDLIIIGNVTGEIFPVINIFRNKLQREMTSNNPDWEDSWTSLKNNERIREIFKKSFPDIYSYYITKNFKINKNTETKEPNEISMRYTLINS